MRSVAVTMEGNEPRFLQWAKSVGLASIEEYRDFVAKCAALVVCSAHAAPANMAALLGFVELAEPT